MSGQRVLVGCAAVLAVLWAALIVAFLAAGIDRLEAR